MKVDSVTKLTLSNVKSEITPYEHVKAVPWHSPHTDDLHII